MGGHTLWRCKQNEGGNNVALYDTGCGGIHSAIGNGQIEIYDVIVL